MPEKSRFGTGFLPFSVRVRVGSVLGQFFAEEAFDWASEFSGIANTAHKRATITTRDRLSMFDTPWRRFSGPILTSSGAARQRIIAAIPLPDRPEAVYFAHSR